MFKVTLKTTSLSITERLVLRRELSKKARIVNESLESIEFVISDLSLLDEVLKSSRNIGYEFKEEMFNMCVPYLREHSGSVLLN